MSEGKVEREVWGAVGGRALDSKTCGLRLPLPRLFFAECCIIQPLDSSKAWENQFHWTWKWKIYPNWSEISMCKFLGNHALAPPLLHWNTTSAAEHVHIHRFRNCLALPLPFLLIHVRWWWCWQQWWWGHSLLTLNYLPWLLSCTPVPTTVTMG